MNKYINIYIHTLYICMYCWLQLVFSITIFKLDFFLSLHLFATSARYFNISLHLCIVHISSQFPTYKFRRFVSLFLFQVFNFSVFITSVFIVSRAQKFTMVRVSIFICYFCCFITNFARAVLCCMKMIIA